MSVSQSSQTPVLAGGYINIQTIGQKASISSRQCKIMCTIGPSCWDVEQLERLMNAGMNTAVLDMSRGTHAIHSGIVERIRQAASNVRRSIAILMDVMGPDLRTGKIDTSSQSIELIKGEILVIQTGGSGGTTFRATDNKKIGCTYSKLAEVVRPGNQILIANGGLALTVVSTDSCYGEVACRIENNFTLGETKNMCIPGLGSSPDSTGPDFCLPTLTSKDIDDIVNFGVVQGVDFISASFVRKGSDVRDLRQLLAEHGPAGQGIKIISKIDNLQGLLHFQDILRVSDAIMICRGDLGMELPPQKIFLAQKMMIRECNIAGKAVIVATQMLDSMVKLPRPTRAECSDVANAVLDGADALLLSDETSVGPYAEQVCRVMARTICEAETSRNYDALYNAVRNTVISRFGTMSATESLASSAVKTAIDVHAKLIVVLSETGNTPRYIAKFKPGKFIVCLTKSATVARQTAGLFRGVHSYIVDSFDSSSTAMDDMVQETGHEAVRAKLASPGDLMVIVCGNLHFGNFVGNHRNNQVRVEAITEPPTTATDATDTTDTTPASTAQHRRTYTKLQSFQVAYNDDAFSLMDSSGSP